MADPAPAAGGSVFLPSTTSPSTAAGWPSGASPLGGPVVAGGGGAGGGPFGWCPSDDGGAGAEATFPCPRDASPAGDGGGAGFVALVGRNPAWRRARASAADCHFTGGPNGGSPVRGGGATAEELPEVGGPALGDGPGESEGEPAAAAVAHAGRGAGGEEGGGESWLGRGAGGGGAGGGCVGGLNLCAARLVPLAAVLAPVLLRAKSMGGGGG